MRSANATQAVTLGQTLSATASVIPGAVAYAWYVGAAGAETLQAITTINSADLRRAARLGTAGRDADHGRQFAQRDARLRRPADGRLQSGQQRLCPGAPDGNRGHRLVPHRLGPRLGGRDRQHAGRDVEQLPAVADGALRQRAGAAQHHQQVPDQRLGAADPLQCRGRQRQRRALRRIGLGRGALVLQSVQRRRRLRHSGQGPSRPAAGHDSRALRAAAGLVPVEPDAERRRGADAARLLPGRLAAAHPPPRVRRLHRRDARRLRALSASASSPTSATAEPPRPLPPAGEASERADIRSRSPASRPRIRLLPARRTARFAETLTVARAPHVALRSHHTCSGQGLARACLRPPGRTTRRCRRSSPRRAARSMRRSAARASCRRPTPRRSISRRGASISGNGRSCKSTRCCGAGSSSRPIPIRTPRRSTGYVLQPGDAAPPGRPQALDLFGVVLPAGPAEPRRLLSRGLRGAGRDADGSDRSAVPADGACALRPVGERPRRRLRRDRRGARAPSSAAPGAGQYVVSGGVYAFRAADAGRAVTIGYGYVPQDVAQAATELAAERFRAAERIGLKSKSLGGQETIAYDTSADSGADSGDAAALQAGCGLMFALELDGLDEASARLDAYPAELAAALAAKAAELAAALADRVRTDKLSGGVLNVALGRVAGVDRRRRLGRRRRRPRHGRLGRRRQLRRDPGIRRQDRARTRSCPSRPRRSPSSPAARCASPARSSTRARSSPSGPICARRSTR